MKVFVVVCAVLLMLLNASKSDGHESSSVHVLNIIVILDTSDRTRHPNQMERDIAIVKELATQFEEVVKEHILKSPEPSYEDSLTIVVPDQPGVPPVPSGIMNTLKIREGRGPLRRQTDALPDEMPRLYEFVGQHRQTGSDIWEWFVHEAEGYFDEKKRNLIVCISDGYLIFDNNIVARRLEGTSMKIRELRDDPNWRQKLLDGGGLCSDGKDFSRYDVQFRLLEIAMQQDEDGIPYPDFNIIKTYWDTWLNSMGIRDTGFRKQGRPPGPPIRSLISTESRP